MPLILLILPLLLPGPAHDPGPAAAPAFAAHKFYVSYGRMAVEGDVAVCRIRFFQDDLELALRTFHDDPDIGLAAGPRVDSLFTAYLNRKFVLAVDGTPIPGAVQSSGEEGDMWWYVVEFRAARPLRAFTLRNTLLFDVLPEQRNIFKISHFPSEKQQSYYFVRGAEEDRFEV